MLIETQFFIGNKIINKYQHKSEGGHYLIQEGWEGKVQGVKTEYGKPDIIECVWWRDDMYPYAIYSERLSGEIELIR